MHRILFRDDHEAVQEFNNISLYFTQNDSIIVIPECISYGVFGKPSNRVTVRARVITSNGSLTTGCEREDYYQSSITFNAIVVVMRGGCTFVKKANTALLHHAHGLVVVNNSTSQPMVTPLLTGTYLFVI